MRTWDLLVLVLVLVVLVVVLVVLLVLVTNMDYVEEEVRMSATIYNQNV